MAKPGEFVFDPESMNYFLAAEPVESIRQALAKQFAQDRELRLAIALERLGWTPPGDPGLLVVAMDALRDAIDAATRQGVNVHWEHLTPKLCAAHDSIAKHLELKAND